MPTEAEYQQQIQALNQQYSDLIEGLQAQRNNAMNEHVNLGAHVRNAQRERDLAIGQRDAALKRVADLEQMLAKAMMPAATPTPPVDAAAAPAVDPVQTNGAAPAA